MKTETGRVMSSLVIWFINALYLIVLTVRTLEIDNDKALILFIVYYGILVLVNFVFWISFDFARKLVGDDFKRTTLFLLAVFIPFLIFFIIYG